MVGVFCEIIKSVPVTVVSDSDVIKDYIQG